ncbi:MAG: polysaccharide deacetylase family protein [Candidatus Omnitrophica bacterium]|nr:polysaccharide deacetylase family protein [Candidatus Omnitrophota bacterium]
MNKSGLVVQESISPAAGCVALTFDDGPHPEYTPRLLDVLARYEVRASFFLVGRRAARYSALVRRIAQQGHEIGNHTYSHPVSPILNYRAMRGEVADAHKAIADITGTEPRYFRPTWALWDWFHAAMERSVRELGYISVRWSKSSYDWMGVPFLMRRSLLGGEVSPGDIFLLHDGAEKSLWGKRDSTISILPALVRSIRACGLRVGLLEETMSRGENRGQNFQKKEGVWEKKRP